MIYGGGRARKHRRGYIRGLGRRSATGFDLTDLVATFGVVAGLALVGFGLALLGAAGQRLGRRDAAWLAETAPGALAVIAGAALTAAVFASIPGPWRKVAVEHFPIRVVDLNIPPANIEPAATPPPPPPRQRRS